MSDKRPRLTSRLLIGGMAGLVGSLAMHAAMRRLQRGRPAREAPAMTPREIIESSAGQDDAVSGEKPAAADLLYGAAMGAILSAANPNPSKRTGAVAGAALWLAGFMGWIPPLGAREPPPGPPRRKLTAIGSHFLWGVATAAAIHALVRARGTIGADGPDKNSDRPDG